MRIISLNTWGGRAGKDKLLGFFEKYNGEADIFCLQEIWSAPYEHLDGEPAGGKAINHDEIMVYGRQDISQVLSSYRTYFHPHHLDNYGLMMLVKEEINVIEEGEVFVYKEKGHIPEGDVGNHARNIQYVTVETKLGNRTVINFHGLWNGKGKTDSEDRLIQSANILNFVKGLNNPFILCGDFNLLPETKSLKKFEEAGLRNLIKEFAVTSTRTSYYTKPEKFADYVFTSSEIEVNDFEVLPDEVSDHAPLLVDVT